MTKRIIPDDAHDALSDAIADLLHVYDGDEGRVSDEVGPAWRRARTHYTAERDGVDGVTVEVVRDGG